MARNKIIYGNEVLIDLTADTVTADKLYSGYTAHNASGQIITGTMTAGAGNGSVYQDEDGYIVLDDEPGTNVSVTSLSVTENGTYTAPTGVAYSPVTVSVAGGGGGITVDDIAMRAISGDITGSATSIGQFAFTDCTTLTTVSFPLCTRIGTSAFINCYSLTTVSFPLCSSIGGYAFSKCSALTTVSFPLCIVIGTYAFVSCSALTTASFPSCTTIGTSAFINCYSLTTVSFPLCTSIGASAFVNCSALTTVSFPLCRTIGGYAFINCYSLTTASFPSCTTISDHAFYNCSVVTTVSFPLCTTISNYAFYNCTTLTTVSFPLCRTIGSYAFTNCYSLTTAIFSNSSTTSGIIYTYAFRSCYNLLSLYLLASMLYVLSISTTTFASTPISNYTTSTGGVYGSIFVPSSLYDAYISSTNWSYFSSRFVSLTDEQIQNVLDYGTHEP